MFKSRLTILSQEFFLAGSDSSSARSYGMGNVRNAKESKTHEKGTERSEGSFYQDGK